MMPVWTAYICLFLSLYLSISILFTSLLLFPLLFVLLTYLLLSPLWISIPLFLYPLSQCIVVLLAHLKCKLGNMGSMLVLPLRETVMATSLEEKYQKKGHSVTKSQLCIDSI